MDGGSGSFYALDVGRGFATPDSKFGITTSSIDRFYALDVGRGFATTGAALAILVVVFGFYALDVGRGFATIR